MIYSFIAFLLGAALASYIEVVRTRNTWLPKRRSKCTSCDKKLCWYELIPILSYVVQRGVCRGCGRKIERVTIVAEVLTGLLFFTAVYTFGISLETLVLLVATIFLVPIVLEDIESFNVPTHFALPFGIISFAVSIYMQTPHLGFILALPFFLLWFLSNGKVMGEGDAQIAISLGFLSSTYNDILSIFIFTFWIGTLWVVIQTVRKRVNYFGKGTIIPLVPFLAVSFYIVKLNLALLVCDATSFVCVV